MCATERCEREVYYAMDLSVGMWVWLVGWGGGGALRK